MLALASLATGFVVAAVTPSHAADRHALDDLNVKDTVGTVDHLVSQDSLDLGDGPLGQNA